MVISHLHRMYDGKAHKNKTPKEILPSCAAVMKIIILLAYLQSQMRTTSSSPWMYALLEKIVMLGFFCNFYIFCDLAPFSVHMHSILVLHILKNASAFLFTHYKFR
jgi:hypothetical protein